MKVILVDDEYYALEGLRMELFEIGGIEIAGMYEDGQKFLEDLTNISPDIIFLDIEMPKINGFELLEKMLEKGITTNIVFVTAFDYYAVKAFEINAVDYIVKPVTKARLLKTLERIRLETQESNYKNNNNKIEINCFKRFSIMAEGKEINTGWRTRKAEELIAYLLCEKGKFVSKEKIAEELWPEMDGEKSLSNLYLAYYYIKKQESKTGVKIPIESERGKMRIRLETVECDMLNYDKLVEASKDRNSRNRIYLMEKAAGLYQGSLMEEGYYSWVAGIQQHYDIEYTRLLVDLIDLYKKEKQALKIKYYEEKLKMVL